MGLERSQQMIEANESISGILIYADSLNNYDKWISRGIDDVDR